MKLFAYSKNTTYSSSAICRRSQLTEKSPLFKLPVFLTSSILDSYHSFLKNPSLTIPRSGKTMKFFIHLLFTILFYLTMVHTALEANNHYNLVHCLHRNQIQNRGDGRLRNNERSVNSKNIAAPFFGTFNTTQECSEKN